ATMATTCVSWTTPCSTTSQNAGSPPHPESGACASDLPLFGLWGEVQRDQYVVFVDQPADANPLPIARHHVVEKRTVGVAAGAIDVVLVRVLSAMAAQAHERVTLALPVACAVRNPAVTLPPGLGTLV